MTNSFDLETDVLVIGAGPAGGSLAAFLGYYGIKGLVISNANGTADTPRAHLTNMATMEVLRDVDLEQKVKKAGNAESRVAQNNCWTDTVAGQILFRNISFGNQPSRAGDYFEASPCEYYDVPQTEMEPLLLRMATNKGWDLRFNTEFVSFEDHSQDGYVVTTLRDTKLNHSYRVKSKYLAGADGSRSKVVAQLGLPIVDKNNGWSRLAINVQFKADLSETLRGREGLLQTVLAPHTDAPHWSRMGILRAVHTWDEFIMIHLTDGQEQHIDASDEAIVARTKELLGFAPVDFDLVKITYWRINEQYAELDLSKGNIFALGDAIHRHPPANGLGSNTCIQDAYNLAWKLAYVLKGTASPQLLQSYTAERQPVGQQVVTQANDTIRDFYELFSLLGVNETDPAKRAANWAQLSGLDPSTHAASRRKAMHAAATRAIRYEQQALGAEMNQNYIAAGAATRTADERSGPPANPRDARLHYHESTYPGFRLPHAWLSHDGGVRRVSTQDLAGHGAFTLLTSISGRDVWAAAAAQAVQTLAARTGGVKVPVRVVSVGARQEYDDLFGMWRAKSGVEESGAVMARPDRVVGWRCASADGVTVEELAARVVRALEACLGFESGKREA